MGVAEQTLIRGMMYATSQLITHRTWTAPGA